MIMTEKRRNGLSPHEIIIVLVLEDLFWSIIDAIHEPQKWSRVTIKINIFYYTPLFQSTWSMVHILDTKYEIAELHDEVNMNY